MARHCARARPIPLCALLLAALASGACIILPGWQPAVRGRVLDAQDGRPIAGVTVHSYYRFRVLSVHSSSEYRRGRTAVTDADGAFFMAGYPRIVRLSPFIYAEVRPLFTVEHPFHGGSGAMVWRDPTRSQVRFRALRDVELTIDPFERWLDRLYWRY